MSHQAEQRTLLPLYMAGFGVLASRPEGGHGKRHIKKILTFWVGALQAAFWPVFSQNLGRNGTFRLVQAQ